MSERPDLRLSEIPGLGPVRQAALAEAGVTDLENLLAMSVAELAAVRGIGIWQARKIREFLRQRGLLVEVELEDGSQALIAAPPQTAEDAAALADSMDALARQEAVEEAMAAEVELLADAVEEAREAQEMGALADEAQAVLDQASSPVDGNGAGGPWPAPDDPEAARAQVELEGAPAAEEEGAAQADAGAGEDWKARVNEQREQLPETALALMEAIRQAAVIPQLTRQMTRLLITASEFVSEARPVLPERRERASKVMARAEGALQAAIERRAFGRGEQKDLARRIRRRRKELEALLEQ